MTIPAGPEWLRTLIKKLLGRWIEFEIAFECKACGRQFATEEHAVTHALYFHQIPASSLELGDEPTPGSRTWHWPERE